MVDVYVGEERKKFKLHRDLLCERSEFFKAAFEGHFKEFEADELALPEDSVESFELLVGWLYGAPLMSIPSEDAFPAYLDLNILAGKLCLEHLQNETMDRILRYYRTSSPKVTPNTIRSVCENTAKGDPLRRLIMLYAGWTIVSSELRFLDSNDSSLIEGGGAVAVEFTRIVIECYAKTRCDRVRITNMDPRTRSNCWYHRHSSTPKCAERSE